MRKRFKKWVMGRTDVMDRILDDASEIYDQPRETIKKQRMELVREMEERPGYERTLEAEQKGFYLIYHIVAVISCILLIGVLLYTVAMLPRYGEENVRADEVVERYVEHGLEETGAVNIVSGMILDYRAFDTLGESHVLFTALICVMILLRVDHKNMRSEYEDYYTVLSDRYYSLERDTIIRTMGKILLPCIFVYGIYILLNGQNSPGGGFSGGAVMGTGLIITAAAFGFDRVDSFLPLRVSMWMTFLSLMFYSFAKGYVFFTGANGLENHIPKGVPGAILSGGLILPLDIAVGLDIIDKLRRSGSDHSVRDRLYYAAVPEKSDQKADRYEYHGYRRLSLSGFHGLYQRTQGPDHHQRGHGYGSLYQSCSGRSGPDRHRCFGLGHGGHAVPDHPAVPALSYAESGRYLRPVQTPDRRPLRSKENLF